MNVLSFLCMLGAVMAVCGQSQYYCGRRLANTLGYLCPETSLQKRATASWWWLEAPEAKALGGARGKRGVVAECCEKPCSLDELLSYC